MEKKNVFNNVILPYFFETFVSLSTGILALQAPSNAFFSVSDVVVSARPPIINVLKSTESTITKINMSLIIVSIFIMNTFKVFVSKKSKNTYHFPFSSFPSLQRTAPASVFCRASSCQLTARLSQRLPLMETPQKQI